MSNETQRVENLITEQTLCELFGCTKSQLSRYRSGEHLPFLSIDRNRRLYLEADVMTWLLSRRKVLNVAESDSH